MNNVLRHSINRIQTKDHSIGTYEINKISSSYLDNKINILMDMIDYHYLLVIRVNYIKKVTSRSIHTTFFSSYKKLLFNFFSSQNNKILLQFSLSEQSSFQDSFSFFICFSINKIVDSEYITNNYQSLKISLGAIIKNPEMLTFVPDHLKTKKMCKHAVKKLPFVIRYFPYQYKSQKMCDNIIRKWWNANVCS